MRSNFVDLIKNIDEMVQKPANGPAKLFRQLIYHTAPTIDRMQRLMQRYVQNPSSGSGQSIVSQSQFRNNLSSELAKDKLTWASLMKSCQLMGFNRVDVVLTGYGPMPNVETTAKIIIPMANDIIEEEDVDYLREQEERIVDELTEVDNTVNLLLGILQDQLGNHDEEELIILAETISQSVKGMIEEARQRKLVG